MPAEKGISLFPSTSSTGNTSLTWPFLPHPSLRHREAEEYHLPKGTMMGQVMLYVMTTVKTHIIQA